MESDDELSNNSTESSKIPAPTDQAASQAKKRKANSPIRPNPAPNPTPSVTDGKAELKEIITRLAVIGATFLTNQNDAIQEAIKLIEHAANNIEPEKPDHNKVLTQVEVN